MDELVSSVAFKSNLRRHKKVLLQIMMFLISISLLLCFTVLAYLIIEEHNSGADAVSFAVVLLVASIPMVRRCRLAS
jgi:magnesium-transporting ATPase (P-type)